MDDQRMHLKDALNQVITTVSLKRTTIADTAKAARATKALRDCLPSQDYTNEVCSLLVARCKHDLRAHPDLQRHCGARKISPRQILKIIKDELCTNIEFLDSLLAEEASALATLGKAVPKPVGNPDTTNSSFDAEIRTSADARTLNGQNTTVATGAFDQDDYLRLLPIQDYTNNTSTAGSRSGDGFGWGTEGDMTTQNPTVSAASGSWSAGLN
jgi:hypothetical protein